MYTHSLIHSHAFVMYIMSSSSFLFFYFGCLIRGSLAHATLLVFLLAT